MKTSQALNLLPLAAAISTSAGCAGGPTTGDPTNSPLSSHSFGQQPVPRVVTGTNQQALSASTPVGLRVATLEEARQIGPRFFGYVQLENGQVAYALRDRYDSKALSAEERDRLNRFERQLESAERAEGKAAVALARQQGKVTGNVLSLNGRAAARSIGKADGRSRVLSVQDSQSARSAAQLEKLEVDLGIKPPPGVTNTVLLRFLK